MSKGQRLRALVNERLTAAAEDIFALFERTIAEYEEELCRSKEENERKQQLLDSVLSPRVLVHRADVQMSTTRQEAVGLGLEQIKTESLQVKEESEEPSIKEEEVRLQEFEPVVHFVVNSSDTVNDEDWEPPASSSTQQMETEADGDDCNTDPNTTGADIEKPYSCSECGAEFKDLYALTHHLKYCSNPKCKPVQCSVCKKDFKTAKSLKMHVAVHTGERPYSCPLCLKTFIQRVHFRFHMANHTGDRPYSCTECGASFVRKQSLIRHTAVNCRKKPYYCPICQKQFNFKSKLSTHMICHSEERPFCCSECPQGFKSKAQLIRHAASHTGVRPYRCSVCPKSFMFQCALREHMTLHDAQQGWKSE